MIDLILSFFLFNTCNYSFAEAAAYEFGPGKGIITYTFPPNQRPEMKKDTVALGFVTSVNDAVLVRIESASSDDYLEIEIVSRIIWIVVYKLIIILSRCFSLKMKI